MPSIIFVVIIEMQSLAHKRSLHTLPFSGKWTMLCVGSLLHGSDQVVV